MTASSKYPTAGAIGFEIRVETVLDLSTATSVKIKYRKPDASTGEWIANAASWTADADSIAPKGTTTYGARYVTASAADLDQVGEWELQVSVVMPGFTGAGQIARLTVLEAI